MWGDVWGGMGRCGEMWGDVGRCGERTLIRLLGAEPSARLEGPGKGRGREKSGGAGCEGRGVTCYARSGRWEL